MKETTGATILMGLAAMILLIFIIMVAFFIGYGKAFRLKNKIINEIEQREGITIDELKAVMVKSDSIHTGSEAKICYSEIKQSVAGTPQFYGFTMSVVVYMHTEEKILKVKIPISGETRIIQTGTYYEQLAEGHTPFDDIENCEDGWTDVSL